MRAKDVFWNMFTMSGDINYYMLYKKTSKAEKDDERENYGDNPQKY
jgi:hypothetical protein